MKTIIITKFNTDEVPKVLQGLPTFDFNTILDNDGYDVHKLLNGANNGDQDAEEMLNYIIRANQLDTDPTPFRFVKATYTLSNPITIVDSTFLSNNDIDFITNSTHERVLTLFASTKNNKVLFVNPYTRQYYIYDAFTHDTLDNIIHNISTTDNLLEDK